MPCIASFSKAVRGAHEAYARELRQLRRLFLSRHPLSCACLSPFLSLPLHSFSLSRSLALPGVSLRYLRPRVPPRPAAVPGCRLPSSVSPASLRPVMSCPPPLASSPTPRHNLPQTLKRSGRFARKSHTTFGETLAFSPAITELHYHNSRP